VTFAFTPVRFVRPSPPTGQTRSISTAAQRATLIVSSKAKNRPTSGAGALALKYHRRCSHAPTRSSNERRFHAPILPLPSGVCKAKHETS